MFPQLHILMNTWFEERIWNLKKKTVVEPSECKQLNCILIAVGVMPVKWRCAVQNRRPAVQSPNTQAYLELTENISGREADDLSLDLCVLAGKDKKTEEAISLADAVSPFIGLTLKEVSSLSSPPRHSPSLEQDRRHVQIPEHSSIKTFWLLTRPQKMLDMCRLQGARQGFSHVTLSLSLKWNITHRNCAGWCSVRLTDFMCVY